MTALFEGMWWLLVVENRLWNAQKLGLTGKNDRFSKKTGLLSKKDGHICLPPLAPFGKKTGYFFDRAHVCSKGLGSQEKWKTNHCSYDTLFKPALRSTFWHSQKCCQKHSEIHECIVTLFTMLVGAKWLVHGASNTSEYGICVLFPCGWHGSVTTVAVAFSSNAL